MDKDARRHLSSKKTKTKKAKKSKVRFAREERLFKTQFFRKLDEPIADPLEESEIMKIKDRLVHEVLYGAGGSFETSN